MIGVSALLAWDDAVLSPFGYSSLSRFLGREPDAKHCRVVQTGCGNAAPPPTKDDVRRRRKRKGKLLLLGIFTTNDEVNLRRLIRETYLGDDRDPRIWSLSDYVRNRDDDDESGSSSAESSSLEECRVVYTFLTTASRRRCASSAAFPTERAEGAEPEEDDDGGTTTRLDDVRESDDDDDDDGKTIAFLKYASSLADSYGIDYVAKADSKALISMDELFEFVDGNEPRPPRQDLGVPND